MPAGVEIASLMDSLRREALRQGKKGDNKVAAFNDAFLRTVKMFGRTYEAGILLQHNAVTMQPFKDAGLGLPMVQRGKINILPVRIKGRDQMKKIFARYRNRGRRNKMRVAYYPGCSLEGSAIEYGVSTERTAEILGFELVEIDDWNCCGATSGHNTDKLLSIALPARNLAIAEKTGLNVLAPCAACYNRFRNTEHTVRSDSELKAKVEQVIGMEYKAENETYSILNYITQEVGLDKIADKVTKPLKGMKAACYYGCLLVRPEAHTGFDDAEYPQSMDNIVKALGAEAVEWAFKTECCGAALGTSQPEIGQKMIAAVLKNAKDSVQNVL
jgi:heterodisulfide reductase subunit B